VWNSLPNDVVYKDSSNISKNRLVKFWYNQILNLIGMPTLTELEVVVKSVHSLYISLFNWFWILTSQGLRTGSVTPRYVTSEL